MQRIGRKARKIDGSKNKRGRTWNCLVTCQIPGTCGILPPAPVGLGGYTFTTLPIWLSCWGGSSPCYQLPLADNLHSWHFQHLGDFHCSSGFTQHHKSPGMFHREPNSVTIALPYRPTLNKILVEACSQHSCMTRKLLPGRQHWG